jgi:hypothetical protein
MTQLWLLQLVLGLGHLLSFFMVIQIEIHGFLFVLNAGIYTDVPIPVPQSLSVIGYRLSVTGICGAKKQQQQQQQPTK